MTEGIVISLEMIEIEMGNRGSKSYVFWQLLCAIVLDFLFNLKTKMTRAKRSID